MAGIDPSLLFPNSKMAAAVRLGQSRLWSSSGLAAAPGTPANTVRPVISPSTGPWLVGSTLTTTTGTWTGNPVITYTYQWRRNGIAIAGATSSSYLLTNTELDANVTVSVTATNGIGSSSMPAVSVGPITALPVNTALPVIFGTAQVGSVLVTTDGTWTGTAPITYTYQWKRGGVNIAGATNAGYLLVSADLGTTITVTVTATNVAGTANATSAGVGPITAGATLPANTVAPAISGTLTVGSVLTATSGTWTGSPTPTYTYQWMRGATTIGTGATTYTTVTADIGANITCVVTATNTGGSANATSNTLVPTGIAPANTVAPVISGGITVGSLLTATSGTWTGTPAPTYTYQWKSGATNVGTGATTYTVVTGDIGANITCVVTGTNVAGSANATSNALGPITAGGTGTTTTWYILGF